MEAKYSQAPRHPLHWAGLRWVRVVGSPHAALTTGLLSSPRPPRAGETLPGTDHFSPWDPSDRETEAHTEGKQQAPVTHQASTGLGFSHCRRQGELWLVFLLSALKSILDLLCLGQSLRRQPGEASPPPLRASE